MEDDLNLINESNDTDNSKVVIFDSEAETPLSTSFGASQGVRLNFVNRSNDVNNSEVVIFATNVAPGLGELAIAWTVIKYCGQGGNHPFTYPLSQTISASDSWGNFTAQQAAPAGQQFAVVLTNSGNQLTSHGPATSPQEIQLLNALEQGAVNAQIYKDGRLFAIATGIAPQQMAVFEFRPVIWIGVASQIEEGAVISSAIVSQVNTEISLLGIASADIVMTVGGAGPDATPFLFTLQNVVMA
jgi:hypothetical protein